ncbi:MAG: dual specificity protein phosphatase family protein [Thermoplasmata archaeon]
MPASRASKRSTPSTATTTASEVTPGFYVGGWDDAETFSGTRFCVLDEAPDGMPPATHVPIYDGKKHQPILVNLDRLADLIGAARARNEPVLVFCGHGVRRAPLAGAWYLHRSRGLSLDESFEQVRAVRPQVEHVRKWAKGWKALADSAPGTGRSLRTL